MVDADTGELTVSARKQFTVGDQYQITVSAVPEGVIENREHTPAQVRQQTVTPWWVCTQQTQNICITSVQCWTNVEDVGPTLYKCYTNVLCLLRSGSFSKTVIQQHYKNRSTSHFHDF